MLPPPSLYLHNARIGYGKRTLITCTDLAIHAGDVIFLSGANGSGKSTFAKTLLGVLPLLAGTRKSSFTGIAYVPQSSHFEVQYPITLAELVSQGLRDYAEWSFWRRHRAIARNMPMLEKLGLGHAANLLLREASGGELQKALIARALVGKPDFLLLDEPFSNLDRAGRIETAHILHEYAAQGTTICVIDHGDALEHGFYNRIWQLENGHLLESGRVM